MPNGLPSEEERSLAQDLLLFIEDAHLAAQAKEVSTFLTRGALTGDLIDLDLADPGA